MNEMDIFSIKLNDVINSEINQTVSKEYLDLIKAEICRELGGGPADLVLHITFNVFIVDRDGFGCGKTRATATLESRIVPNKLTLLKKEHQLAQILKSYIYSLFNEQRLGEIKASISRIVKSFLCADLLKEELSEVSSYFDDLFLTMLVEFHIIRNSVRIADQIAINFSKVETCNLTAAQRNPYMEDMDLVSGKAIQGQLRN